MPDGPHKPPDEINLVVVEGGRIADRLEPGPMGRPSKLTPERKAKIVDYIKGGNYIEVACAATGIDQRTYYHWMAIGKAINEQYGIEDDEWPDSLSQHERDCGHFFQDVRKATAEAEAYAVLQIRSHFPDQWAAAMTYLERRHPGRWRRRDEIAVNPFEPGRTTDTTIDESAMLNDPRAVELMHEALAVVAAHTDPGGEVQRGEAGSPESPQLRAPDVSGSPSVEGEGA